VIFSSRRKTRLDLLEEPVSGTGIETLRLADDEDKTPTGWSADGRFLLYTMSGAASKTKSADIWVLPMEGGARFSADTRWVAYAANESSADRTDVYVVPFQHEGAKMRVSKAGGAAPQWRRGDKELLFVAPDNTVMSAEIEATVGEIRVKEVKALFRPPMVGATGYGSRWDVSSDSQKFLVNVVQEVDSSVPLTVVVNWPADLKK
jgi:Tol biopolymer transport system component